MKNLKSFNETSNGEYHKALDSSSNKAINDRFFFDQDESSHWYMIPLSLKSRWLSLNSQNDDESNDLVDSEFGEYRTNGGITDISFENPQKF